MRAIDYQAPTSLSEAVSIMAANGDRARPLAGGTDVLVQLRGGRREADVVVDTKKIPELNTLNLSDSGLQLGAAVPCYRIYQDSAVAAAYPGLIDAAGMIGSIQIQGRATVGGNLCNAAPSGDTIPPVITLGGEAHINGPNGWRTLPAEDFCTGPGRNALENGELLVAIQLPAPAANSGTAYLRFIPRNEMDIAVAGVSSTVQLDASGQTIQSARIALASVGPTPILATAAGDSLAGKAVSDEAIAEAGRLASEAATPITDMRGTIRQRHHLVDVLTRRTLNIAIRRARGEE
ncbi:MAG: xanthine dehydrogenase family protein subunit M [Chloroflexota bacterium]|nr:xanthine dehydrogenase family protein subunit M [Chloroflexota bacterium]MDE2684238.1 xanthine dehydrogenase family protein subunit M [Chloroflexota bacterium]